MGKGSLFKIVFEPLDYNLVFWILYFLASLSAIETKQMGDTSPLCILEKAAPVNPTCIM